MADIDVRRLTAAARALMLAGRWAQATGLLADATAASPAERTVLAVAQAEVAVDQDFWSRTNLAASALEHARAAAADAGSGFNLEFLRLKHDYADELFGAGDAGGPNRGRLARGRLPRARLARGRRARRSGRPGRGGRPGCGRWS